MHVTLTAQLVVYALAVARVTRLITADRLFADSRDNFVNWAWKREYGIRLVRNASRFAWEVAREEGAVEPRLAYLVTCSWCASIYVGAAAAPLWYWLGSSPWVLVPAAALALSYVTGFLARFGE
jgi:hypothetical protein